MLQCKFNSSILWHFHGSLHIFLVVYTDQVQLDSTSAGCVMLYDGQGKFHRSTTTTLKFVVSQANYTVDNLRNLSDSLSAAKKVDIGRFLLPPNVQNQINEIQGKLDSSANDLAVKTTDNAAKIKKLLNQV